MVSLVSPVPQISISLAPPQEPLVEPYSPFSATGPLTPEDPEAFRPSLLSPPPALSPQFARQLSPLRPADSPVKGQGLERERFEAMLRASKERNALVGGKKSPDLRKEIALKVHTSKQLERRALFLSKVHAPPSPTSTLVPKTPPESPAVFHYSLPSPGLESPLAVFENLVSENPNMPPRRTWVEQVDFRVPGQKLFKSRNPAVSGRKKLPTLDEITARLNFQGQVPVSLAARDVTPQPPASPRLPAFLQPGTRSQARSPSPPSQPASPVPAPRRALPAAVGRLKFPTRAEPDVEIHSPTPRLPPSPTLAPKLQITTTVVPRISSNSPTEFTESNLKAFAGGSRERTARDMLTRLRRRTLTPSETFAREHADDEERKLRRRSAPPELPLRERVGFSAPKLNLPGAF